MNLRDNNSVKKQYKKFMRQKEETKIDLRDNDLGEAIDSASVASNGLANQS